MAAFEAFAIVTAREDGREIVEELDGIVELVADGENFAVAVPRDAFHADWRSRARGSGRGVP